jgi:hypothetical protein
LNKSEKAMFEDTLCSRKNNSTILRLLSNRKYITILLLVVIITTGIVRIIISYNCTSITFDEPFHVYHTSRLWNGNGFDIHDEQPGLTRIIFGVIPYLKSKILKNDTLTVDYSTILSARYGNLIFFIVLCIGTFLLANYIFSEYAGILSVFFLSLEPTILGHSALATVDIAVTCCLPLGIYIFLKFIAEPNFKNSALFSLILAISFMSKFSILPFLGLSYLIILLLAVYHRKIDRHNYFSIAKKLFLVVVCSLFILWGFYGFQIGTILSENAFDVMKNKYSGNAILSFIINLAAQPIFPLNAYMAGIARVAFHNMHGHTGYLFGKTGKFGWWYYFPVAIAVKTILVSLLFSIIGAVLIIKRYIQSKQWLFLIPVAVAVTVVLFSMCNNLNIGIRHILPAYPFFMISAGYAVFYLWKKNNFYARLILIMLIMSNIHSSLCASGNYIAYFNIFGGSHPENILVDSNLDWGQDYDKLIDEIKKRNIKKIHIVIHGHPVVVEKVNTLNDSSVFCHIPKEKENFFVKLPLDSYQEVTGWIAISYTPLKMNNGYSWLENFTPVKKIGESILLFYIPHTKAREGKI